jgi:hypothetical protein
MRLAREVSWRRRYENPQTCNFSMVMVAVRNDARAHKNLLRISNHDLPRPKELIAQTFASNSQPAPTIPRQQEGIDGESELPMIG